MNGFTLSFIKYIAICVNKMLVEKQMISMEFLCCKKKQKFCVNLYFLNSVRVPSFCSF